MNIEEEKLSGIRKYKGGGGGGHSKSRRREKKTAREEQQANGLPSSLTLASQCRCRFALLGKSEREERRGERGGER